MESVWVVQILIPVMTFLIGLLIGLFYKYSDINTMKVQLKIILDNMSKPQTTCPFHDATSKLLTELDTNQKMVMKEVFKEQR